MIVRKRLNLPCFIVQ
ncbi:hypothetical protein TF3313_1959 [Tannerella forsythia 3313]|nr:hypothetical protein TF3313_1959 [Tannerella forsythia 3313]